ncbi:hypothetical protein DEO72_LG10g1640 [Vigna unguiculata]|uniref:Uncharacterized protein n=1 Tax=Vigna unguiculata TaxID=3917 RepID=A0A4D6N987_VIGUN|nr:hypothetical protein DEO72_LG3g1464 [Vigna unguiculata]QCE10410.1 hypothetical protein DEO72_LG10g1640 [Vigna unguiculata]
MMVALREFSGGVKLRRFMARADAGVGAVEMAMVVARGAVGRENGEDGGVLAVARGGCGNGARDLWLQVRASAAVAFCSGEVKEDGGAVTVQIPARRRRLPWRVEGEEKIRVRVLGDEDDDVAESEWSIG